MRARIIIPIVVALVGAGIIAAAVSASGSASDFIKSHYRRTGTDGGSQVYFSPKPVTQTVQEISNADSPGDRRTTESGVFLRYPNYMVGVLVNRGNTSRVEVANQRTGYNHFYGYIGGFWGSYTGPAGVFRGGGPGAGK